jgi:trehalose/maltose hydrolase-like predicted phosphorylase
MVKILLFQYKKDQAPLLFQQFEQYFSSKKIELSEFKDSFYKLADLKTKYVKALSKLNQVLLPSYENTLFNWFNGTPI